MPCQDWSREQIGNLGPDAARARNRRSMSTARCARLGRDRKDAGVPKDEVPALHREAERDTTGSISRQPPVHTWIDGPAQGKRAAADTEPTRKRRCAATVPVILAGFLKLRLTVQFYCDIRAA